MALWHYAVDGRQLGPVEFEELVRLLQTQRLPPDALVWTPSLANWAPAASIPELAAALSAVPPPPPAGGGNATWGAPTAVQYAGFWKRVVAAFIDGLVMTAVGLVLGILLFGSGYPAAMTSVTGGHPAGNLVGALVAWLYAATMESSPTQATLGKMALGIKVTDLEGRRLSFARATGRHFAKILSTLTLFFGYLMVAFTERKQGLHDMVAGCLVVDR